ncbi:MAG: hypothetical protein GQ554_03625 [Deltaproteobacteria bacterium]|nr:hypothetical protein [Deltaproteobacteria bacterium]
MEFSFFSSMKGIEENDEEEPLTHLSTKKKGPAKKLPKSKRKLLRRLKKL